MYDKDKVDEAIELCKDIDRYYEKRNLEQNDIHTSYHNADSKTQQMLPKDYFTEQTETYIPQNVKAAKKRIPAAFFKDLLSLVLCVFVAYGIARFITDYIVQPTRVEGISMEDTLNNNDILLIDKISYRTHDPERFDVIIFPYSMREYYVKRVIGLPGETIQIKDGFIYINDVKLKESYGNEPIEDAGIAAEKIILSQDQYFLLGDNRNYSTDSRSIYIGPVEKEKLEGKVWARIFPFDQIKIFH